MAKQATAAPGLDISLVIEAPRNRVLKAFFDADALGAWWQVTHSVTTPRTLGAYAIEWAPTDFRDEVLGRLGGVFRGTVMQFEAGRGFFVADAYWLPPDGDPIGPMALDITCTPVQVRGLKPDDTQSRAPGAGESRTSGAADLGHGVATQVRVVQTGFEESARWRRYYEIVGIGWERALVSLKMLLEK